MIITGTSTSRLIELRKYVITNIFTNQYVGGGTEIKDGVDYINSTENRVVYYLGGIKYIDVRINISGDTRTTYSYLAQGWSSPDFIVKPIYKDPNKENIISNPKINNDVFIKRQEISAFDSNYKLEFVKNLVDLESYAGGSFFNIVKNS